MPRARELRQRLVAPAASPPALVEIGQQREVQVARRGWRGSAPRALRPAPRWPLAGQHRRHHDQRARLRRDADREIHARQRPRLDQQLANQLTSATASWLAASSATRPASTSIQPRTPAACAPSQAGGRDGGGERRSRPDTAAACAGVPPGARRRAEAPARAPRLRAAARPCRSGRARRARGAPGAIAWRAISPSDSGLIRASFSTTWR